MKQDTTQLTIPTELLNRIRRNRDQFDKSLNVVQYIAHMTDIHARVIEQERRNKDVQQDDHRN